MNLQKSTACMIQSLMNKICQTISERKFFMASRIQFKVSWKSFHSWTYHVFHIYHSLSSFHQLNRRKSRRNINFQRHDCDQEKAWSNIKKAFNTTSNHHDFAGYHFNHHNYNHNHYYPSTTAEKRIGEKGVQI